ncbi:MAG TPA: hypothetical protein VKU82_09840 [Planctomycetaceae bacterium]|nr:hypothetical protein [Planctomycetaceae bacterium]
MQIRPHLLGLAVIASAGCQSYFPNGYGYNGPYSTIPGGTYVPPQGTGLPSNGSAPMNSPRGGQFPTPTNGQMNNPGQSRAQSPKNSNLVPNYRDAGGTPATLGAPGSIDEEADSIRRPETGQSGAANRNGDDDEADISLSSVESEHFLSPTPYRPASATSDDPDARRTSGRSRPSPYKYDREGYKWLRGVVSRDPKSDSWRVTYSRDPLDSDQYGGSLTLVDDESLDTLMEDDVVLVYGRIDPKSLDRYGKPSYRASEIKPLKPKDE